MYPEGKVILKVRILYRYGSVHSLSSAVCLRKRGGVRVDRASNGTGLSVLKYAHVSMGIFFIRMPRLGKNDLFSKWCWDNGIARCKRMTLGSYLKLHTEISSKWVNDLNVNYKSL